MGVIASVPFTFQNNTTADGTQVNANFAALVASFLQAAAAGANSDITSLSGLTTPLSVAQGGSFFYQTSTFGAQTANAQVVATTNPTGWSLTLGNILIFPPTLSNTAQMTLNVKGTGALNVYRRTQLGKTLSVGGEVIATNFYIMLYDGTGYVNLSGDTILVGEMRDWGGSTAPPGWLFCDGSAISRTTYADLFTVIGTTFGIGDGVTTFNVPDLRGRVGVGKDGAGRISTAMPTSNTVGATGGAQNQSIALANLPAATVNVTITDGRTWKINSANSAVGNDATMVTAANTGVGNNTPTVSVSGTISGVTANLGSGTALTTLQPTLIVNKIIRF